MPLSLYALLKSGVDVNCRVKECCISPISEHFNDLILGERGQQIIEVLKIFEVGVSFRCGVPFIYSELHRISYVSVSGDIGNFFKPSLNKKRSPLQRFTDHYPRAVRILDECYDAEGYLPIHRAAQGGNVDAIKWFKSVGVNTQLKTQSGLTALDISILYLKDNHHARALTLSSGAFVPNTSYRSKSFNVLLRTFFNISGKKYSSTSSSTLFSEHRILHLAAEIGVDVFNDVYNNALKIIPGLTKNKLSFINEQDANGDTPLHIAAREGLDDVVKYIVRLGANTNIWNNYGDTPLDNALFFSADSLKLNLNLRCYTTNDRIFTSCRSTPHDEIARFLIWSKKSSISKCDAQSAYVLNQVFKKRMPLSLYALLKAGVNVRCQEHESLSPLLQHLRKGGHDVSELSEVLKIFEIDVSVKCEVPFISSELHLISYVSVSGDYGNFFKPSLNKKRSPLQRLIDRHPRGVRILDECYDAEGYLPIHRAAQGGNLDAIRWFTKKGVTTQLKTRSSLTALDISMLYLGDNSYGDLIAPLESYLYALKLHSFQVPSTSSKYRHLVFKNLLRSYLRSLPQPSSMFLCGPALEGLSPLHMAAVKGMNVLRYVHKKASEIVPSLPINCVNKHQLDPVYLAEFYDSVLKGGLIVKYPGENAINHLNGIKIQNLGKKSDQKYTDQELNHESMPTAQHPDREVEYIMVYNYLYYPQPINTLSEDIVDSFNRQVSSCLGYYNNLSELTETAQPGDNASILCPLVLSTLRMKFTALRRRNRKLSPFIAKSLGWSDISEVTNIDDRWPFYFLRKKLLKEYEAYEYLKILNEALEVGDIRFYSRYSLNDP